MLNCGSGWMDDDMYMTYSLTRRMFGSVIFD